MANITHVPPSIPIILERIEYHTDPAIIAELKYLLELIHAKA